MKKLGFPLISVIFLMAFSCKKETVVQKSNFDYLTGKTWMFKKYYVGYVDANNPGVLQYERGAQGNQVNLDNNRSTYLYDNTIQELAEDGNQYPGEWHFTNDQLSELVVSNSTGDYYTTVVLLDDNHYNWYYTDYQGVKRYGEYVPAP